MIGTPNAVRIAARKQATQQEILDAAWHVAHADGLAGLTLRRVATRVHMQPPSLYSHFASKNAIYDAMFEQAWTSYLSQMTRDLPSLPEDARARLTAMALHFFDFSASDPERYQLMNVRSLVGFTPSAQSYRASQACFAVMVDQLAVCGVDRPADSDIYTALLSGLVAQQLANDPGGTRWRDLVPRTMQMFADGLGLPTPPDAPRRPSRRRSP